MARDCILIGAPMDCGKARRGCLMGPDAYRTAGLAEALSELGHAVRDAGDVAPDPCDLPEREGVHALPETVGWTAALARAARAAMGEGGLPIFMGGDHALSLGTVAGVAAHAAEIGRPLFVLWLDAHSDAHTPATTASGNLHGTPVGYLLGRKGFSGAGGFPPFPAPVPEARVMLIGIRSVDAPERAWLEASEIGVADMRAIDEHGVAKPLRGFLSRVATEDGLLHVSLDVDFLDPSVAPAVGTTVPGGATFREAHLVMETLHDAGLVTSLDLVELNPLPRRARPHGAGDGGPDRLADGPARARPPPRPAIRDGAPHALHPLRPGARPLRQRGGDDAPRPLRRPRALPRRADRRRRGGLPPLGVVRPHAARGLPLGRGGDRADADLRRGDLRLQVRQRPSAQHPRGAPDRDPPSACWRASARATRCCCRR